MRRILLAIYISILVISCQSKQEQQPRNVIAKSAGKAMISIDVTKLKDTAGKFKLIIGGELFYPTIIGNKLVIEKNLDEPRRSSIAFYPNKKLKKNTGRPLSEMPTEIADHYFFFAMPGMNQIEIEATVSQSVILNPTKEQKDFTTLIRRKADLEKSFLVRNGVAIKALKRETIPSEKEALMNALKKDYNQVYKDSILSFIRENPESSATLVELEDYSYQPDKDVQLLAFLYNNLHPTVKQLPTARRIHSSIDSEDFSSKLIGKSAPNFTQSNPHGKPVSLKDYLGKVTLIEFWASWCGPCRAANPNLVEVYTKYKRRGFSILGISLDDNRTQWIQAIKTDQLSWEQTSDLKSFDNAVARQYHVTAIPSNYLLDKSGRIVACSLDNKQLTTYLEKMLK